MLYRSNQWFTDQLIITWALLSSKVCSVPASSNLWPGLGLQFDPALEDSGTCYHGFGYEDCNRNLPQNHRIRLMGCKWWHFIYYENIGDHLSKFYQPTNNSLTIDPLILAFIKAKY